MKPTFVAQLTVMPFSSFSTNPLLRVSQMRSAMVSSIQSRLFSSHAAEPGAR